MNLPNLLVINQSIETKNPMSVKLRAAVPSPISCSVTSSRWSQAIGDSRHKIFACLGLLNDKDNELAISPDYQSPTEHIP
jgi:hypothetical protein